MLVTLQRGFHMVGVGGVPLQHPVVGDQSLGAHGQENLVAEFHRFLSLAPLDQIRVELEDRVDFLLAGNRLSLDHPAAGLVDDAVGKLAVEGDLLPELVDHQARDHIDPTDAFGLFDRLARVLHYLPGDPQQFAVLGFLLLLPLLGSHPLELLHAAASAAGAIGKSLHPVGKLVMEISHQTSDSAHRVPQ